MDTYGRTACVSLDPRHHPSNDFLVFCRQIFLPPGAVAEVCIDMSPAFIAGTAEIHQGGRGLVLLCGPVAPDARWGRGGFVASASAAEHGGGGHGGDIGVDFAAGAPGINSAPPSWSMARPTITPRR
jgi:hypothetical protein